MIELGKWFGLRVNARSNAVAGSLVLWIVVISVGLWVLRFGIGASVIFGLVVAVLHFSSEMLHQFGHAIAARHTGYPMNGITFAWVLALSRYPSDEGELPARTHLGRAIGGPIMSLAVTVAGGLLVLLLRQLDMPPPVWWVALVFAADNLLVFTLGALLPLGFTDGSTIQHYWKQR